MEQEGYQRFRPHQPVLTQRSYRINVSIGFLALAFLLFALVLVFEVPIFLRRGDFHNLAQVAADLSAICLALVALVHELGVRGNKYLKLALCALSLVFILAALLSVLVLATTDSELVAPFERKLKVVVLIWVFTGIAVTGMLRVGIGRFVPIVARWLPFLQRVKLSLLKTRFSVSSFRVVDFIVDYSVFMLPVVAVALWASPLDLASITLVLMIGGLANVVALSIVFAIQTIRQREIPGAKLKPVILEVLRDIHAARCAAPVSSASHQLVDAETLMAELAERDLFANESTILGILREMQAEDLLFARYNSCYIFPTRDDIDSAVHLMDSVDLAVSGYAEGNGDLKICEGVECTFLVRFLSRETRYPIPVVRAFFLPAALVGLQADCDISESEEFQHRYSETPGHIELYARSQRIRSLWEQVLEDNVADPEADDPVSSSTLLRNLAERWTSVPSDLRELGVDERCLRLFVRAMGHLLGVEIVPTE